jgi:hypothetical protein
MTSEQLKAMARYEEARGRYRVAVLASLRGAARGDVIRRAIRECRSAAENVRLAALSPQATTLADQRTDRPSAAEGFAETWAKTG